MMVNTNLSNISLCKKNSGKKKTKQKIPTDLSNILSFSYNFSFKQAKYNGTYNT